MNTSTLIFIVIGLLVLTPVLRFILQPRIRQTSPRKRHLVFAVLGLGIGPGCLAIAAVLAVANGRGWLALLFLVTSTLFVAGSLLEMRELRKEF